jgi:hypothetical protein
MLSGRALLATTALLYTGVCLFVLLAFKPWMGGDGAVSYSIGINLVSFPSGMIASYVLSLLSDMAIGTTYEWINASPSWWLLLLIGCGVVGYGQWRLVSRLLSRSNVAVVSDAPPATGGGGSSDESAARRTPLR